MDTDNELVGPSCGLESDHCGIEIERVGLKMNPPKMLRIRPLWD